jgi:hypothetical protein
MGVLNEKRCKKSGAKSGASLAPPFLKVEKGTGVADQNI